MALYLAAEGVGTLGIADADKVDESKLQRQVIQSTATVGKPKTESAKETINALNPEVKVIEHRVRVTRDNAIDLFSQYDLIVDGSDNFSTRYLVNDVCVMLKKPHVHVSIFRFDGQVTTFKPGDRVLSNGPHAEVVNVPVNLCARIADAVPDDTAVFGVIGAIALQGIRLLEPTLGEQVLVTGGRNLENTYYDHSTGLNYRDRDVLVAGPAARAAAESFEEFWRYRHAVPSRELTDVAAVIAGGKFRRYPRREDWDFGGLFGDIDREAGDDALVAQRFAARLRPVARAVFVADEPGKGRGFFTTTARITRELRGGDRRD